MAHIVMLLSNAFRPDPRVLKEANSLAEAGYQVTILCWDRARELPPAENLPSGVRVERIQNVPSTYGIGARQALRMFSFWKAAWPRLRQLRPDLLHCHDFDTLPLGLWYSRLKRVPVVYDAHEYYADLCKPRLHGLFGTLLYHMIRLAEHLGARLASAVVTVDETLAAIYRRRNRRVVIIGHYPALNLAPQAAPVFTHPTLTLLYIGRLSTDRGLLYYADLLRSLQALGVPARLCLAGVFTPASEEQALRAHLHGLEEAVQITGWVDYAQVPALLHSADIGLAVLMPEPRYVAALPVKLFEYMAAGLPVLASNFPPIAAVMTESQCGLLVDPLAPPTAAAASLQVWWEKPATAQVLGQNGRQAVQKRYNWASLMQTLVQLYQTLLQTK